MTTRRSFLLGCLSIPAVPLLAEAKTVTTTSKERFNACKLWIWAAANREKEGEEFGVKCMHCLGKYGIQKYKPIPGKDMDWERFSLWAQADIAQTYLLRHVGNYLRNGNERNKYLVDLFSNRREGDPDKKKMFDNDAWFTMMLDRANLLPPDP